LAIVRGDQKANLAVSQQMFEVWRQRIAAWHVAEREAPTIAAELVTQAFLKERIIKRSELPLILHAHYGNGMGTAALAGWLKEHGLLRSYSEQRMFNDDPHSDTLLSTEKCW